MSHDTLSVGQAAPDFTLSGDRDETFTLSEAGQPVILYFYPKDMTPGCTVQACDFRDFDALFTQAGYKVIGISPDGATSHDKFRSKHGLPFTLLSDTEHEVSKAYGVWREKTSFGKTHVGMVRSTFVIDEQGKIAAIYDKVKAKGHTEQLLKDLGVSLTQTLS